MIGFLVREYVVCLEGDSISSGALERHDLLLSYSMIALKLHNTIILIITRTYFNP